MSWPTGAKRYGFRIQSLLAVGISSYGCAVSAHVSQCCKVLNRAAYPARMNRTKRSGRMSTGVIPPPPPPFPTRQMRRCVLKSVNYP